MSFQRSRRGSAADRQKIVSFPAPQLATAPKGPFRRLLPGMVTGASDVDPSLVITATVAGSVYHYSLLWSVLLCVPFLLAVFAVSARIGVETRQGLVDLLRTNYGRTAALLCALVVVTINMAMIVADLMAVSDGFSIIMELPRSYFVA
ncbi:MAG TPA: divalent metal cation transporter, partial [Candidatus Angelobacter sp.]|nr:divalent metal cation transporter [Candidatus Angelobacter sp.]